ncbi:MAG: 50S ribosomal protein L17 [Omnitrophica WOR_2 bacterium RIFCSPHIGHO2_02_FULL_52_10]|nr:MAG: 50S ribosomal protein L17 [Omnitrophica WOR_2 bacterium RIFCSPHIGHO2_02_FULL_52_10]
MRHGIAGNKLSRNSSLRKATVRDIAKATLVRQRICTTQAKAKEARKLVEKLITLGKNGSLADKRRAFAILCDHQLVSTLFTKTSPRFKQRNGGYTRIIPLGTRRGDNARLAFLELTEKEEIVVSKPKSTAAQKKDRDAQTVPAVPETKKPEARVKPKETTGAEKKEQVTKPEPPKPNQVAPSKDLGKAGKRFSVIRKIFNRKAPGQ